jgi:hypothetical protein
VDGGIARQRVDEGDKAYLRALVGIAHHASIRSLS